MKNLLLCFVLIVAAFGARAQKVKEYTASNGVTYRVGDTVRFGRGTGINGKFVYLTPSNFSGSDYDVDWIKRKMTNGAAPIKAIKIKTTNGVKSYHFTLYRGEMVNNFVDIEAAIQVCEVLPCKASQTNASVADELKKMKELLDSGVINHEEFEKQKKKLLN